MAVEIRVEWATVLAEFQRIWGYPDFRKPQDEIVRALQKKKK
jgi:superfamily II DNA helicase RecQ